MAKKYLKGCKPSVIDLSVIYTGCDVPTCTGEIIENGMTLREVIILLSRACYEAPSVEWGEIIGSIEDQTDLVDFIQGQIPAVAWGNINGNIEDQEDLINYLADNFYDKGESDELLDNKVDKEEGKSLVDDDQIDKLEDLDTQDVIDQKISEAINLSNSSYYPLGEGVTELPVPPLAGGEPMNSAWVFLTQGVTYTQDGGNPITALEGHDNRGQWDGSEWSLVDMGELPQVQGTESINPNGEDIPKEKAVARYIDPIKSKFKEGTNKANKNDIKAGYYLEDGVFNPSINWIHIVIYGLENNVDYRVKLDGIISSGAPRAIFFDSFDRIIGVIMGTGNSNDIILTPPVNCSKTIINIANVLNIGNNPTDNSISNSFQINKGVELLPYEKYSYKLGIESIDYDFESIPSNEDVDMLKSITKNVISSNLIPKSSITAGEWYLDGSTISKGNSVNWISTEIITVNDTEADDYYVQGLRQLTSGQVGALRVLFWNMNDEYLGAITGEDNNNTEFSFTPPVFPFKFALNIANVVGIGNNPLDNIYANTLMVNKGNKLPYEEGGDRVVIPASNIEGLSDYVNDSDKYLVDKQENNIAMYYYAGGNTQNWVKLTFIRTTSVAKFVDVWKLNDVSLHRRIGDFDFELIKGLVRTGVWENAIYTNEPGYTDAIGANHGWEINTEVLMYFDGEIIPVNQYSRFKCSTIRFETKSNFMTFDGEDVRGVSEKTWTISAGRLKISNNITWIIPTSFQQRTFVAMWSVLRNDDDGNRVTNRGMSNDEWVLYDVSLEGFSNPLFASKNNNRSTMILEGQDATFEMYVEASPILPNRGFWVQNTSPYNKMYFQLGETNVIPSDVWNISAEYSIRIK